MIGEEEERGREIEMEDKRVRVSDGYNGKREKGKIGFEKMRGG